MASEEDVMIDADDLKSYEEREFDEIVADNTGEKMDISPEEAARLLAATPQPGHAGHLGTPVKLEPNVMTEGNNLIMETPPVAATVEIEADDEDDDQEKPKNPKGVMGAHHSYAAAASAPNAPAAATVVAGETGSEDDDEGEEDRDHPLGDMRVLVDFSMQVTQVKSLISSLYPEVENFTKAISDLGRYAPCPDFNQGACDEPHGHITGRLKRQKEGHFCHICYYAIGVNNPHTAINCGMLGRLAKETQKRAQAYTTQLAHEALGRRSGGVHNPWSQARGGKGKRGGKGRGKGRGRGDSKN